MMLHAAFHWLPSYLLTEYSKICPTYWQIFRFLMSLYMLLDKIYEAFPSKDDCLLQLETLFWNGSPVCPACGSARFTALAHRRYHCNSCNRNYRVTVDTVFHDSKCDLQKWFAAIILFKEVNRNNTVRGLAKRILVTKDTASYMKMRLRDGFSKNGQLMKRISHDISTAIDKVELQRQMRKSVDK
jgi:transposase-like protein